MDKFNKVISSSVQDSINVSVQLYWQKVEMPSFTQYTFTSDKVLEKR